ncbi:MAG: YsnF/AvaK domain-containing protein [Actinomycetota bacterium]|nr:YsnF/AvaK domain-containing protein [Actinomycetota bacterium]
MSTGRDSLVRYEEELDVGTQAVEAGTVRARKTVETDDVDEVVGREIEHADVERVAAAEGDSGEVETLPDGSVSIPVLEEELVITKRLVVRERILIRKRTVTEEQRVRAELRRERVEIEGPVEDGGDD